MMYNRLVAAVLAAGAMLAPICVDAGDDGLYQLAIRKSGKGTVKGGGRYSAGTKVKLTATPAAGYVFSSWRPESMSGNEIDFSRVWARGHVTPFTYTMPAGDVVFEAEFIKKSQDYIYLFLDGESKSGNWAVEADGSNPYEFMVESGSYVTIKATGLPAGLKIVRSSESDYYFYIKVVDRKKLPRACVKTVKITAVNRSGKSHALSLKIRFPNRTTAVSKGVLDLDTSHDGYRLRAGVKFNWDDLGIYAEDGWKITNVTGLPGVKWNVAKQKLTGVVSKKGTYFVTFTVTRGKTSYTATATFRVSGLPSAVTGTFNGITSTDYDEDDSDHDSSLPYYVGMKNARLDSYSKKVKVAVTSAGKVTAKIGGVSFSGTGLTYLSNSVYKVSLKRSQQITSGSLKGCTRSWSCEFEIDGSAPWNTMQLKGEFWSLGNNCIASMGGPEFMVAQRNPFGKNSSKKYVNSSAGKIATGLYKYGTLKTVCLKSGTGVYELGGPMCVSNGNSFPLSFKVNTAGVVTVAGKVGGLAVSGTSVLRIAPSTWDETPWSAYDYEYDESTGQERYVWTGNPSWQADFCLTVTKKPVRIHIEFSPENGGCRHGWVTIGSHRWNEYRDYDIDDNW